MLGFSDEEGEEKDASRAYVKRGYFRITTKEGRRPTSVSHISEGGREGRWRKRNGEVEAEKEDVAVEGTGNTEVVVEGGGGGRVAHDAVPSPMEPPGVSCFLQRDNRDETAPEYEEVETLDEEREEVQRGRKRNCCTD